MDKRDNFRIIAGICIWILATNAVAAREMFRVATSVLPQAAIIQSIGGEWVEVLAVQSNGDACGTFEARPQTVAQLNQSAIYFRTGVAFEESLLSAWKRGNPDNKVVDLRAEHGEGSLHEHGEACGPGCGGADLHADPHTWMNPREIRRQAAIVGSILAENLPSRAAEIQERTAEVIERAAMVDQRLRGFFGSLPENRRSFLIYHPALGHLAAEYGLEQIGMMESGKEPSLRKIRELAEIAREKGIATLFVQPQENQRPARLLARQIGAKVVEIDPMDTDWENNLLRIGSLLVEAMRGTEEG